MITERAAFPAGGTGWDELKAEMGRRSDRDIDWRSGRSPLFVFQADEESYEIGRRAFFEFFTENALGRKRAFFGLAQMERDVLDYGLSLFSAPADAEGAFTTGGSESIFMAVKAARDALRARRRFRPGQDRLNLVMPITAHPGFDKACDAMDIEIRRGAVDEDRRATADSLRPLIDERTVAIVGSAPCFPHGVVDRIDDLSQLALDASVWLHVDACVGGWLAPWFTRIGRATPDFDFRFPGVRSISADLHKFGFTPKPASTVFYRDAEDLARATFSADAWPNGRFETPTLTGTRPGGAVAAAWAVLNHLGESGYSDIALRLSAMTDAYVAGIETLGLRMIARPDFSIINYTADDVDIFRVAEAMAARGWLPGLTRDPRGMHAMMSLLHEAPREAFLSDLADCLETVRSVGRAPDRGDILSARAGVTVTTAPPPTPSPPSAAVGPCPVCRTAAVAAFLSVAGRNYLRCYACEARFLDPRQHPSPAEEHAHYLHHENDPDDARYRRFLSRLAEPLLERLRPGSSGLDYGCGPGPALAAMLREAGHRVALYDPFFAPDAAPLRETYDFVTCTETAEHFHRPADEFDRLAALVRPGGWLAVMTCFQTSDEAFAGWHYRKDPTHVVFYREQTLRRLAAQRGWSCEVPVKDVALMRRPGG